MDPLALFFSPCFGVGVLFCLCVCVCVCGWLAGGWVGAWVNGFGGLSMFGLAQLYGIAFVYLMCCFWMGRGDWKELYRGW